MILFSIHSSRKIECLLYKLSKLNVCACISNENYCRVFTRVLYCTQSSANTVRLSAAQLFTWLYITKSECLSDGLKIFPILPFILPLIGGFLIEGKIGAEISSQLSPYLWPPIKYVINFLINFVINFVTVDHHGILMSF